MAGAGAEPGRAGGGVGGGSDGRGGRGGGGGGDEAEPEAPPPEAVPVRRRARRRIKRRSDGSGHVRKLPSGNWNGQVMLGYRNRLDPATGRMHLVRDVRSVTRKRREDVEAELARLRAAYRSGTLPDDAGLTLADLFERWLTQHVAGGRRRSAGTVKTYRNVVDTQLAPRVGHLPLAKLGPLRLVEAINALGDPPPAGGGYAQATVARAWAVLHAALTWAVNVRLLERHPLHGLEGPARGEPTGRVLRRDEVQALLDAARRDPERRSVAAGAWYPFVALLAFSGMRLGDALGLTWGDVAYAPVGGDGDGLVAELPVEARIRSGKSRRAARRVVLSRRAAEALEAQRKRIFEAPGAREALRGVDARELPVFLSPVTGRAYAPAHVEQEFRRLVRAAGIAGRVVPHDLRHTWNATADALRFGARARASHLGHTPEVNVATYTHEDRDLALVMVAEVEKALTG